jgi:vacuolar-type H+-ATPase subunit I/STV1
MQSLSAVEAELRTLSESESALRAELEQTRTERDEAIETAASLKETRAAKDNQVLRGIIARLNVDLAQRSAEVLRAKRARSGLKIAYVVFGLGLLGVIAFAIKVLPQALRP